ncbi:hypothetical protein P9314_06335 [Paenibacillus validus]|uniref:Uncharacterized protein n=1 Tax=Paenibacillus validus TaxID=44253 RepID=A0A7X3CT74_9BACL|nr:MULTISPECIES: hypothetical protein [Paenibacillus]MED4600318.1 hypothetical protein [Paenibacillus validus]MED4606596.1 hypothetical protein [Paenibacillus validus]MUG72127.1 hypothetical protein [Paenibacillus validus]
MRANGGSLDWIRETGRLLREAAGSGLPHWRSTHGKAVPPGEGTVRPVVHQEADNRINRCIGFKRPGGGHPRH